MRGFYKKLPSGSLIRFSKVSSPTYTYTEGDKTRKNLKDGIQWHETLEAALASFGLTSNYSAYINLQLTKTDKQNLQKKMQEDRAALRESELRKTGKSNREIVEIRRKAAKKGKQPKDVVDKKLLDDIEDKIHTVDAVNTLILLSIQEIE